MKKVFAILLIMCICMTGCSLKKVIELEGREQVEEFVNSAKTWQSGRYMLTNLDTNATDQVFSFMNNTDGTQSFLYENISEDGKMFVEYSDGRIFRSGNEGEVKEYPEGDDGYVSFTADEPHPYATGELLFYVNLYALGSSSETDGYGNITYKYTYDTEKINKAVGTSLTKFETTYTFDKEGNFLYFTQTNSDGEESYSYMIEVLDVNSVTELDIPEAME